ncbi:hypothetical protein P2Q70_08290 [Pseudomonas mendocina]|uniref:hypothetical protein n=1 Tax=Ectopseudomonas mendocina TaxID=300 RepID=UPI0023D9A61E|nr:hypothetical protein [Pseudomonas mendocina]MDF2074567.1 hypothetical protein [Pseudomonas mendocina]
MLKRLAKLEGSDFLNISSEYVCLTAKGGAAWEERFKPEWSKYIRVEVFYRCKCEFARIGCLDFSNLESFVGGVSGSAISFSKIKRVSGWAPRYWKRFEFGYQMLAVVADAQVLDEYCLYAQSSWRLCWKTMDFSDGLTK